MSGSDISVRELRNNVSAVLRRVEAGERLRVTVNRRPVAELVPLTRKPTWVSGEVLGRIIAEHPADPGLRDDLEAMLSQTTDDLWPSPS